MTNTPLATPPSTSHHSVPDSTNAGGQFSPQSFLAKLRLPKSDSHKGENGKLMIIGGSDLFHAASRWSLDVASKFVDMVFYSSVPSNNELIQAAKGEFWNGIVIGRDDVASYIEEADAVLIGPGMERTEETQQLTNSLLRAYPTKKWVIDAGALQMVDPSLLTSSAILTPHSREMAGLASKPGGSLKELLAQGVVVLQKGEIDAICWQNHELQISGGNAGMTKGGTGDVLAGLVAALYTVNEAVTSAVVGSYVNKKAGDELYQAAGPFFNATELVESVGKVLWRELKAIERV